MLESQNFGFLAAHDPTLAHHGALAEHYFSLEPRDCVAKLRQMSEYLAKLVAAYLGLEATAETSFVDVLRLLRDHRALPPGRGSVPLPAQGGQSRDPRPGGCLHPR